MMENPKKGNQKSKKPTSAPKPPVDYSHLNPNVIPALSLPPDERKAFARAERWFEYPEATRGLKKLKSLYNQPRRSRMRHLALMGDTNSGKSRLLEKFAESLAEDNGKVESVLICVAPQSSKFSKLLTSLIHVLGGAYNTRDDEEVLIWRIETLVKSKNIRMLALDEAHGPIHGSPPEQRYYLSNLRRLSILLGIPFVLIGTSDVMSLLYVDQQIANRFQRFELHRWSQGKEFQQLLQSFQKSLPLPEPSNLAHPKMAQLDCQDVVDMKFGF